MSSALALFILIGREVFWLNPLIESAFWEYSGKLAGVIFALILLAVIACVRTFRSEFKIRFGGTWLLLIPAAFLAVNMAFMTNPLEVPFGLPMLSLILGGFATGIKEEVFLRGFAFAKGGELTPRYTVLLSSVVFGMLHLFNLTAGYPIGTVIPTVILTMSVGISLGLIRVITGSIFWCVVLHGIVNATYPFANSDSELYQLLAFWILIVSAVVGLVCVFVHPKMRPNHKPALKDQEPLLT